MTELESLELRISKLEAIVENLEQIVGTNESDETTELTLKQSDALSNSILKQLRMLWQRLNP